MNKIREDIFRIKGKQIAKMYVRTNMNGAVHLTVPLKFVSLDQAILDKEEIEELVNWLISKMDEM